MHHVAEAETGHGGRRGIGWARTVRRELQQHAGLDTADADLALSCPEDNRVVSVRLKTNNPTKAYGRPRYVAEAGCAFSAKRMTDT
jgi:hypothetical protein